jgi:hypothetical protein
MVRADVIELVEATLAGELPGPMHRALLELQDDTARMLRVRAFDASAPTR